MAKRIAVVGDEVELSALFDAQVHAIREKIQVTHGLHLPDRGADRRREQLLSAVWAQDPAITDRAVDVYMQTSRRYRPPSL